MATMMRGNCLLTWFLLIHVFSLALFLIGFFPIKRAVVGFASIGDQRKEPVVTHEDLHYEHQAETSPVKSRLVFVLIDALRADFVLPVSTYLHSPAEKVRIEFVYEKVANNESWSFLATAHPPTVTMPRIKALTSGGIPAFVDVAINLEAASLQEDNFVTQLHRAGKKIIFYGDDTWIKLFPDHFIRSEGTHSFFVPDYTEVDLNVTRHLESELRAHPDWDVMILHYLGLDHIGHLVAPSSDLVKPKLSEMDAVVHRIFTFLEHQDSLDGRQSLLVVCGDHGMSDQGSHGGVTYSETATPFVMLSPTLQGGRGIAFDEKSSFQIDMVPAMSLLLGLPVPQNNLGVLPPGLLSSLDPRTKLQWIYINAQQLLKVYQANYQQWEQSLQYTSLEQTVERHRGWLLRCVSENGNQSYLDTHFCVYESGRIVDLYRSAMLEIRDQIAKTLSNYDVHLMCVAIGLMCLVLLSLITVTFPVMSVSRYLASIKYPVIAVLGVLGIFLQISVCTGSDASPLMCHSGGISIIVNTVLAVMALSLLGLKSASDFFSNKVQSSPRSMLRTLLICGCALHIFSMLSSSFIEEEHQTWYFLTQSLIILLGVQFLALGLQNDPLHRVKDTDLLVSDHGSTSVSQLKPDKTPVGKSTVHNNALCQTEQLSSTTSRNRRLKNSFVEKDEYEISAHRYESSSVAQNSIGFESNIKGQNYCTMENHEQRAESAPNSSRVYRRVALLCWLVACVGALGRRVNQTGDKWLHLPDISDWLVRPDNRPVLSALCLLSLLVTCGLLVRMYARTLHWAQHALLCVGALGVYCYRTTVGDVLALPYMYGTSEKANKFSGLLEARLVYCVAAAILLVAIATRRSIYRRSSHHTKPRDASMEPTTHESLFASLHMSLTLVSLLLMRPQNVCVVALETVQICLVSEVLRSVRESRCDVTVITLLHLWMGKAAFFHFGNSNCSLASVDIAPAFVGMTEYNPAYAFLAQGLYIATGPLLWKTACVVNLYRVRYSDRGNRSSPSPATHVTSVHLLYRTCLLGVYFLVVTSQRYHLFVWTVFSPKLLFEAIHTLVFLTQTAAFFLLEWLG